MNDRFRMQGVRPLFRLRRFSQIRRNVDDEILFHLESRVAELTVGGLAAGEAREIAMREFGDLQEAKEDLTMIDQRLTARETRANWRAGLRQDLRNAARSVRRRCVSRPGFVAAVVLTLALGIGANTAVFSLIDSVLLRPVLVVRPEEMVMIHRAVNPRSPLGEVAYPEFETMRAATTSFEGIAGWRSQEVGFKATGNPEQLLSAAVSGNFFSLLGVRASTGRSLTEADDRPGAPRIAMLGDRLAARAFGSSRGAVGMTVRLGGRPFVVVGTLPDHFRGLRLGDFPQVWVPLRQIAELGTGGIFSSAGAEVFTTSQFSWVRLVGRLRTTTTHATAVAELNVIDERFTAALPRSQFGPEEMRNRISAIPLTEGVAIADRENLIRFVRILAAVAVLTLLIACLNVANLFLMDASARARELGVRVTLGATRARVVSQLFTESLILAFAGGLAGVAVALLTMRLLSAFTLPGGVALTGVDLSINGAMLAFTLIVAVASSVLCGLFPALSISGSGNASLLRGQGTAARGGPRDAFIAAQVTLSVIMLIAAALFLQSLRAGLRTDLGFDPAPLASATIEPRLHGYDNARLTRLYALALDRLRALPDVEAAAVATHVPLARTFSLPFSRGDGAVLPNGKPREATALNPVSPGYFEVLGVPIVAGRDFRSGDAAGAPKVAIVNESASRQFFGSANAVGGSVKLFTTGYEVVGVVRDTKYALLTDADVPMIFVPVAQEPGVSSVRFVVRGKNPDLLGSRVRRELMAIDPNLPVSGVGPVAAALDVVMMPQRLGATLLVVFGLIALGICAVGIYGIVAFAVSQRRPEIGVRIALGARGSDVVRLVARSSGVAIVAGGVAGVIASAWLMRLLERFLYGVEPIDFGAFAAGGVTLIVVGIAAIWMPARSATRTDPLAAIKST